MRVHRFIQKYSSIKLHDYFQIPNTPYQSLTINFYAEDLSNLHVLFHSRKVSRCPSFNLPPELVYHIKEYLPEQVDIHLNIAIPLNYPFESPRWEIISAPVSIWKMIEEYNNCHNAFWSPAISIEKDILWMTCKLLETDIKYLKNI